MDRDFEYYSTKEFERVNAVIEKNATNLIEIKQKMAVLLEKQETLKARLDSIESNIAKLVWFILLAVGAAVLKLVIVSKVLE